MHNYDGGVGGEDAIVFRHHPSLWLLAMVAQVELHFFPQVAGGHSPSWRSSVLVGDCFTELAELVLRAGAEGIGADQGRVRRLVGESLAE